MAVGRTQILSTHKYRRVARVKERLLQARLDYGHGVKGAPTWANGVRVEKAGDSQFAVVFTEKRGH